MTISDIVLAVSALVITALATTSCLSPSRLPDRDHNLGPAWAAWERGDFSSATQEAHRLLSDATTLDDGRFVLALTAHVRGDHQTAVANFEAIDDSYRWYGALIEPMLWSYVFAGDYDAAIAHATRHRLGRVVVDRIRLAASHPLKVSLEGPVELPFTQDELSRYMPGIAGTINGHEIVARLDTGGSYLHVSRDAAVRLGIETIGCDRGFASLRRTRICYGIADLELGTVRLRNVPVAVHAEGLSAAVLAEHFESRMDAIIGTNILQQFSTTIDGPNARMILSSRADGAGKRANHQYLHGDGTEVSFGIWADHLMIASGTLGGGEAKPLFVDSGLVMVTPEHGQASLLMPHANLRILGISPLESHAFTDIPGKSGFPGALRENLMAYPVADSTWRRYGNWGGVDVFGLVGWGYLKHYTWTIDFDRRVYVLRTEDTE